MARRSRALSDDAGSMKALVFHGPGKAVWTDRPRPRLQDPTDAIVRITKTTICATDVRLLKGGPAGVAPGRVLGHEGVGHVEEIGSGVSGLRPGDKVLVSCVTSCGTCGYCRKGLCSHCRSGGFLLGHTIDGTQAEYVRVPHAETSLHKLPVQADEEAMVMLSELFPTAFECGVLQGRVKPGDTVAILGAGPVGLAALLTARFSSPAEIVVVDSDEKRLDVAQRLGATHIVDGEGDTAQRVMDLTGGLGVDAAIETGSLERGFEIGQAVVAPGGRVAHVPVHGSAAELRLEKFWASTLTLTNQPVQAVSTPTLLRMVQSGQLEPAKLVTHHFELADAKSAYDAAACGSDGVLKVILSND